VQKAPRGGGARLIKDHDNPNSQELQDMPQNKNTPKVVEESTKTDLQRIAGSRPRNSSTTRSTYIAPPGGGQAGESSVPTTRTGTTSSRRGQALQ